MSEVQLIPLEPWYRIGDKSDDYSKGHCFLGDDTSSCTGCNARSRMTRAQHDANPK